MILHKTNVGLWAYFFLSIPPCFQSDVIRGRKIHEFFLWLHHIDACAHTFNFVLTFSRISIFIPPTVFWQGFVFITFMCLRWSCSFMLVFPWEGTYLHVGCHSSCNKSKSREVIVEGLDAQLIGDYMLSMAIFGRDRHDVLVSTGRTLEKQSASHKNLCKKTNPFFFLVFLSKQRFLVATKLLPLSGL